MDNDISNFLYSYNRYNEVHLENLIKKFNEEKVQCYEGIDIAEIPEKEQQKIYKYRQDKKEREAKEHAYMYRMLHSYETLGYYKKVALDSVMKSSVPNVILQTSYEEFRKAQEKIENDK
jgi:hypothetical protein